MHYYNTRVVGLHIIFHKEPRQNHTNAVICSVGEPTKQSKYVLRIKAQNFNVCFVIQITKKQITKNKGNDVSLCISDSLPLADVDWLRIGTTDEYSALKKRIAHICHDVTDACCIDEICINDILVTFRQFGYEVVKCK